MKEIIKVEPVIEKFFETHERTGIKITELSREVLGRPDRFDKINQRKQSPTIKSCNRIWNDLDFIIKNGINAYIERKNHPRNGGF